MLSLEVDLELKLFPTDKYMMIFCSTSSKIIVNIFPVCEKVNFLVEKRN